MRHLFIIASIIFLTSPLFGNSHKGETLYGWETSSGIQWREFGDKDIHPQYKGDVENGKPNGLGVIINTNKGKYVGEWKDGIKQGQGIFTYGKGKWEGEKYEGEFKEGYRHGQGTYTWSDGDKYVGEFKDDKPNGKGTYNITDGDKYVGEWKNGKEWNITLYEKNGNIIGRFVDGVKQ